MVGAAPTPRAAPYTPDPHPHAEGGTRRGDTGDAGTMGAGGGGGWAARGVRGGWVHPWMLGVFVDAGGGVRGCSGCPWVLRVIVGAVGCPMLFRGAVCAQWVLWVPGVPTGAVGSCGSCGCPMGGVGAQWELWVSHGCCGCPVDAEGAPRSSGIPGCSRHPWVPPAPSRGWGWVRGRVSRAGAGGVGPPRPRVSPIPPWQPPAINEMALNCTHNPHPTPPRAPGSPPAAGRAPGSLPQPLLPPYPLPVPP